VPHVLHEDIAIQQYENLRNRNAELVLGRLNTTINEPDLVAEPLFDEPLMVAAGSENGMLGSFVWACTSLTRGGTEVPSGTPSGSRRFLW
jgi:hypothetical protein